MRLGVIDWAIVAGFFLLNVVIGLAYARRAGGSTGVESRTERMFFVVTEGLRSCSS